MKSILKILLFISGLIIMEYSMKGKTQLPDTAKRNPVLVIHGGAGTILKKNMGHKKYINIFVTIIFQCVVYYVILCAIKLYPNIFDYILLYYIRLYWI